jgi:hypothetical protein
MPRHILLLGGHDRCVSLGVKSVEQYMLSKADAPYIPLRNHLSRQRKVVDSSFGVGDRSLSLLQRTDNAPCR